MAARGLTARARRPARRTGVVRRRVGDMVMAMKVYLVDFQTIDVGVTCQPGSISTNGIKEKRINCQLDSTSIDIQGEIEGKPYRWRQEGNEVILETWWCSVGNDVKISKIRNWGRDQKKADMPSLMNSAFRHSPRELGPLLGISRGLCERNPHRTGQNVGLNKQVRKGQTFSKRRIGVDAASCKFVVSLCCNEDIEE
ncbi:hypothetical protein BGZ61DRAFT_485483 [Ilyonectria robusta]|uniref:uncharacterized protein n=1 Tax=Ilyonectria robusta TaxID=1079257 RepID=UPI001E8E1140|nr:uncharacterized protein BGZ61DRAFT_485483 [Ilyonectria robusta]KAH8661124.1 hypothetical protein BGZ61DRAFT_485483 [Ilyonectria robusta]